MGISIMFSAVVFLCAVVQVYGDAYIRRVAEHRPLVVESAYDDYADFDQYDDTAVVEVLGDDEVLVEQYHGLGEGPDGETGTYASSGLYQQFIGEPTRLMYRRLAPRRKQEGGRVVYREHTEAPLVRLQAVREHVPARVVSGSHYPAVRSHHGAGHDDFVRRDFGGRAAGRHGIEDFGGY